MKWFPTPAQRYAQKILARFSHLEPNLVPVRELDLALNDHARLFLTGASGAGKTTALASLAISHARALAANPSHARIPILLDARELHPQALPRLPELPVELDPKFFDAQRALVLIDNIDVLPIDAAKKWLAEFSNVVVTGNAIAPELNLTEFPIPLWRDQDIENFTHKKFGKRTTEFLAALKANGIPRLLTSRPMCISLLAQVWETPSSPSLSSEGGGDLQAALDIKYLPTRRAELFSALARASLGADAETARMLEGIALAIQRGKPATNEFIAKSKGFLVAAKNSTCDFSHELWRAYFAARAARLAGDMTAIQDHLQDPGWREVILFFAGLGDASELVNALIARGDWHFAGEAIANAKDAQTDLIESVTKQLLERAWNGDVRAAVVLGEMQSDAALGTLTARLKDPDAANRARAAEILGRLQMDRALEYLLPQMRDINANARDHVVAALGNSLSNRVIEPLLGAFRGDPRVGTVDTRMRIAAAQALGQVGSDKAVPALIVDLQIGEPEVRALAAHALKRIHSPLMIKPLKGILASIEDKETRQYITDVLASMNGAATNA